MSRHLVRIMGAIVLSVAVAGLARAQDPTTTTTIQTKTAVVQNTDGSWTVVEYPVGKEVTVNLTPTAGFPGAVGVAKITRNTDQTMINLDLKGLTGNVTTFNLYAVDDTGHATILGPITVKDGVGAVSTTTPLNRFMLVLSPDADLTTIAPNNTVVLRSAVPEGYAVVPLGSSGEKDGAAVGEKVAAVSTTGETPAYSAPLLDIPNFRRGTDTQLKINFKGAMTGSRANISLEPRKDGPTTIVMRFHELKNAPEGKVYAVWAVSPENKFQRLGQVVNTGQRNEAEIKSETQFADFGLFVTLEDESTGATSSPTGVILGTINK